MMDSPTDKVTICRQCGSGAEARPGGRKWISLVYYPGFVWAELQSEREREAHGTKGVGDMHFEDECKD